LEFCDRCGSMMISGGCTNKRCRHNNKEIGYPSFKQMERIKDMMEQLHMDEDKLELQGINNKQAATLIKELEKMMQTEM
jgi:DNA-directed RNA polymerase subunit M/transcription elongation factor TFIIS